MRYVVLVMTLILVSGCSALSHKAVNVTTVAKGGKITMTDPTGSGNPMPSIIMGEFTGMWNSCPPGGKMEATLTTYQLFSSKPSVIQSIKIDCTSTADTERK